MSAVRNGPRSAPTVIGETGETRKVRAKANNRGHATVAEVSVLRGIDHATYRALRRAHLRHASGRWVG